MMASHKRAAEDGADSPHVRRKTSEMDSSNNGKGEMTTKMMDTTNFSGGSRDTAKAGAIAHVETHANPSAALKSPHVYIREINLKNFLCHKNLSIDLHPDLNFITGVNGSGKSAIFTSLVTCFAGKMSSNDRGSLKNLVRNGTTHCKIEVIFNNVGSNACDQSRYGSEFKMVRTIRLGATPEAAPQSIYEVLSADNEVIGKGRDAFQVVLDQLKININNPMDFMNQTMAKKFLITVTPSSLYKYFYEGTGALTTEITYMNYAKEYADLLKRMIPLRERYESIRELRVQNRMEREKYENVEHNRMKLLKYEQLSLWREYIDLLGTYDKEKNKVKNITERLDANKEKIKKYEENLEKIDSEIKLCLPSQSDEDRKRAINDLKVKRIGVERKIKEITNSMREQNGKIDEAEIIIESTSKKLEKLKIRQESGEEAKALEKKKMELDEVTTNKRNREKEVQEYTARYNQLKTEEIDISNRRQTVEREMKELGESVTKQTNLVKSASNPMKRFSIETQNVYREIQKDPELREHVFGPIGMHVKIKQEYAEFRNVLWLYLGKFMNNFVTTDARYKKRVLTIIKKCNSRSYVNSINMQGNNLKTDGEFPSNEFVTVSDALEINHPVIYASLLLDSNFIKSLLVRSIEEGDRITSRGFPRNVKRVFTRDCYNVGSNSGKLVQPIYRDRRFDNSIGLADVDETQEIMKEIERGKIEYGKRKEQVIEIARRMDSLTNERRDLGRKKENAEREARDMYRAMIGLQSDVSSLERRVSSEAQNDALAQLEDALRKHRDFKKTFETELEELSNEREKEAKFLVEFKHELSRLEEENLDQYDKVARKKQLESQRGNIKKEISKFESKIVELEKRLSSESSVDLQKLQKEVESKHEVAVASAREFLFKKSPGKYASEESIEVNDLDNESCPQMSVIKDKMTSVRAELEAVAALGKDIDAIITGLEEKAAQLKDEKKRIEAQVTFLERAKSIPHDVKEGLALLSNVVDSDASAITNVFNKFVKIRYENFKLKINTGSKTIKVENISDNKKNGQSGGTASMSGGEKSFSAFCLMVAIWDHTQSAVRALDEYDVFTDSANRNIMTQMILDQSQRSNMQYILISPLDLQLEEEKSKPFKVLRIEKS